MKGAAGDRTSACTSSRPPLGDHCVVLKTKSCPTKASRIWKEHVRFLYGKKKCLSEAELDSLKDLQDRYYQCTHGSSHKVSFWVESPNELPGCRYLQEVPYLPASLEDLREEIRNNGVSNQQRRKRKKLKNPPSPLAVHTHCPLPPGLGMMPPNSIQIQTRNVPVALPLFALTSLEAWREQVGQICNQWTCAATCHTDDHHWVEQLAKKHLVEKLLQDLDKYAALWQQKLQSDSNDSYDQRRKTIHSSLFLEAINRLGNEMVAWYDQDLRTRRTSNAASTSARHNTNFWNNPLAGHHSISSSQDQETSTATDSHWTDSNYAYGDGDPDLTSLMEESDSLSIAMGMDTSTSLPLMDAFLDPTDFNTATTSIEDDALSEITMMALESHPTTATTATAGATSFIPAATSEGPQTSSARLYWQQQEKKITANHAGEGPGVHWQQVAFPNPKQQQQQQQTKLKTIQE